jgi:hypothetical protein
MLWQVSLPFTATAAARLGIKILPTNCKNFVSIGIINTCEGSVKQKNRARPACVKPNARDPITRRSLSAALKATGSRLQAARRALEKLLPKSAVKPAFLTSL